MNEDMCDEIAAAEELTPVSTQKYLSGLEKVGLGDRTHHRPTELSGGQMQRVAIARALAMEPDILLADEPTGNLDTNSGTDVLSLLQELWNQGSTLIVVTHDTAMARRANRLIEIRDGLVVNDQRSSTARDSAASSDGTAN